MFYKTIPIQQKFTSETVLMEKCLLTYLDMMFARSARMATIVLTKLPAKVVLKEQFVQRDMIFL